MPLRNLCLISGAELSEIASAVIASRLIHQISGRFEGQAFAGIVESKKKPRIHPVRWNFLSKVAGTSESDKFQPQVRPVFRLYRN